MKIVILLLIAYFLMISQANFLSVFGISRYLPNMTIVFVLLVIFLEPDQSRKGIILAGVSGLLFDLFLGKPVGFYGLIFLAGAILIKLVAKKHIWLKIKEK
ncbi:MAG: hypothetical protein Q8N56_00255 [bacterium]|nr:hypothetical protein [bacterium]